MLERLGVSYSGTLRDNRLRLLEIKTAPDSRAIFLDPVRLMRWVYVARLSVASAIFIAAVIASLKGPLQDTAQLLVASVTCFVTFAVTAASAFYTRLRKLQLRPNFYYLQSVFDLLLVTAVVHLTRDSLTGASQFAALYILVIATASLLLPANGGLLIALFGDVLYVADSISSIDSVFFSADVWWQVGVFAFVALGSAYLTGKLQEARSGTEDQLAHARLQAADILFNIQSGVLTVDATGRLVYANPMAERLLGVDLAEFIGKPVLEEIRGVASELADALERSLQNRSRTTRAEGIIATVEKLVPIGVTTTYTDGDGLRTDRTATAIFQDISDQKRLDTLRLRAERLEGIAELSASLAHEIRNPLASIRSAVEQLSRSPFSGTDERTLAHLVMRESDRLSRLLSEFLDFARVRVARFEPLDLTTLVTGTVRLALSHPDREQGVAIVTHIEPGPFVIEGDDDLLHRAVFNLLLNAIQASPPNGEIRLDVSAPTPEQIGSESSFPHGAVAISVSDSGPGIPPGIRDRVFDPFFTTKLDGSGLGLAIVHRAIDAHRGLVLLDSGPAGTRFTIVLPCLPRPLRSEQTPISSHTPVFK
jgi:two-component system sensor histidine kinase PilS (NtrC family)